MKRLILPTAATTALAALATLGLTGCGKETPDADFLDDTTFAVVTGRLLVVDSNGKNPRPSRGTIVLTGENGSKVTGVAAQDGTFEVKVIPGDYQVGGESPQPDGGTAQCAAQAPRTTVVAETPTRVDVLCFVQ